ncbi:MAG: FkbM family methyltransferase [Nitrososphaera sp.]|nr:FkbM family methyltransferase [Nitrososphaera sp.]
MKEVLRGTLGDAITGWIHAFRLASIAREACATRKEGREMDMALIPAFVSKGEIVVDVGANGADWTLALSRQVGAEGRVFAFEADPYYAGVTRKTIKVLSLKNVTLFPFGLSDKTEISLLNVRDSLGQRVSGTSTIVRGKRLSEVDRRQFVEISLETLDKVAIPHPKLYKARLIKCDVEGFELMVMRGALGVLERARPVVIVEVGGAHLHGYSDEDLFRFFKSLNYSSYVAVSERVLRESTQAGQIPEGPRPNRVMIPNERPYKEAIAIEREKAC